MVRTLHILAILHYNSREIAKHSFLWYTSTRKDKTMTETNTYGIIPKEQVDKILKRIGKLVNTHRQQKQWSMAQLAKYSGTSSSLISDLENCKGKVPSMFTLMSIARALNIPDDSLIKIFLMFNKEERSETNAETLLHNLLLTYQVPTGAVNDVIILLNMLAKIGDMYHNKNSKSVSEENSVQVMNELINLYSQYDQKTKSKSHNIEE